MTGDIIKDYIRKEKELSEFKIRALQRTNKIYKERLINKEKSFINFDFYSLNAKTIDEIKKIIILFKTNKNVFMKKYCKELSDDSYNFRKKIISDLNTISVDTENGSIGGFLFPSLRGKDILKSDGSLKTVFLKRLVYMKLLIFFLHEIVVKKKLSSEDIESAIYFSILREMQSFRNYSFLKKVEINSVVSEKIIDLFLDLFTSYSSSEFFIIEKTKNTNLIVFPIKHKGNEKIRPLYIEMYDKKGSKIMVKDCKFSNHFKDGEYWKCLRIPSGVNISDIDFSRSLLVSTFSRRMMDVINETRMWFNIYIDGLRPI
jgi:hypothetical protein